MTGVEAPLADPRSAALATAGVAMAFALKHYAADFMLQTNWMARGKERLTGWLAPLLVHALCHALLTLLLTGLLAPKLWWLALIDLGVHLAVDRAKTTLSRWGQWKTDQAQFWWVLGFDQLIHQLTNIGLACAIVLL